MIVSKTVQVQPVIVGFNHKRPSFSGIMSEEQVLRGSVFAINGTDYEVMSCKLVECVLFVANGHITLEHNGVKYRNQAKVSTFIDSVGFTDRKTFARQYFRKPFIDGFKASVLLWYCSFKETTYFG